MSSIINKVMYISELEIKNYRSIKHELFFFKPFAILIGKNNAGKSNIMKALKLLLEGNNKDITVDDFYNRNSTIILEAKIENAEQFLDLSSEPHRTKIKEDLIDKGLKLQRIIEVGPKVGKLQVFNPEKKSYGLKTGIDNALKQLLPEVIYIEAFHDPIEETLGKSSATLGKIIKQILDRVTEQTSKELEKAFEKSNILLNITEKKVDGKKQEIDKRSPDIRKIEEKIRKNIQSVFEDIDVRIKINLPEIKEIMAKSGIELKDGGTWTIPELKGQGVQRTLYVALWQKKCTEYNLKKLYFFNIIVKPKYD